MTPRQSNLPLVAGVVVSLALHATALPGFLALMSAGSDRKVIVARFDPESFSEPDRDTLILGIETERATPSTLTWIGYDEYQEHLALLSETAQAAFRTEPTLPAPPTPTPAPEPTPAEAAALESADGGAASGLLTELEERLEAMRSGEGPATLPQGDKIGGPKRLDSVLAELAEAAAAEPSPATPPRTEPEPSDDTPADVSDLEADPTSTVDVEWKDIRIGKPLAASGLTVKPRRPEFTLLTRMTAAPANPHVEIRFDRRGVPVDARILSSSGDSRVDEGILNSLYRWRAHGKQLEALEGTATYTVRIRIVLGR